MRINTWRGFSEEGTREWECAVDDSEKTSTPFETSVMLIITMIVLCFALTFRLWKRKWQSRRREIEEREDLEASVRSESEIKFRTQDEMYEHWKSCVQPDGTKVICVEIEPRRKKNFDYDEDDLVIPLDANGNVVVRSLIAKIIAVHLVCFRHRYLPSFARDRLYSNNICPATK